MSRLASGLIAGMALGAAGAYFCLMGGAERGFAPDAAVGLKSSAAPSAVNRPSATALPTVGGFSERSAVYQLAADADPASLRSRIEEGAARPESAERRFLLATLLARYAEFSPREAIALAADLELDNAIVASVYASWAGTDPETALDTWSHSNGAREGYAIGLAMFQALGSDEQAFSILLTSLPPDLNTDHFQVELVKLWAQTAPEAALRKTLTLRSSRYNALGRVAAAWSELDPLTALSAGDGIGDLGLRRTFQSSVLYRWCVLEPETALEHIIASGDRYMFRSTPVDPALTAIAQSDPQRALEYADRLPRDEAQSARRVVMSTWAMGDLTSALTYVQSLSTGSQRDDFLAGIAQVYGRKDPEAAFEWARNLKPGPSEELSAVVGTIARTDPNRAMELVLTLDSEATQGEAMMRVASSGAFSSDTESFANKLATLPDGQVKDKAVGKLVSNWVSVDFEVALTWLFANADRAGDQVFGQVARSLGRTDPEAAAGYTSKVPPAQRESWVKTVAPEYLRMDPAAAFEWISQYQGEPAYEAGLAAMIWHSAEGDPGGAARMLGTMGDSPHAASAASGIGYHWARAEPRSAAAWAEGMDEGRARLSAMAVVARQWVDSDRQAAQRWVLDLPSGSDRDAALSSLVSAVASKEAPDAAVWNAFSSDVARHQVLSDVIYDVAERDRGAARALVDEYVSDSNTRQQIERFLR